MQKTENYGLNKPEGTDKYNIEDINANMDIIDAELQKLFQRGDEVKQELVSRLIALGEEADTSKTFDDLFSILATVKRGSGTAQPNHVLTGQTFTNSDGVEYEGIMPNLAGATLDANSVTTDNDYVYTTPDTGFYDDSSKIRLKKCDIVQPLIIPRLIASCGTANQWGNAYLIINTPNYTKLNIDAAYHVSAGSFSFSVVGTNATTGSSVTLYSASKGVLSPLSFDITNYSQIRINLSATNDNNSMQNYVSNIVFS